MSVCSCVCFSCVRFSFFSTMPRDWPGRLSAKLPILCSVGRKTLQLSYITQTIIIAQMMSTVSEGVKVDETQQFFYISQHRSPISWQVECLLQVHVCGWQICSRGLAAPRVPWTNRRPPSNYWSWCAATDSCERRTATSSSETRSPPYTHVINDDNQQSTGRCQVSKRIYR